MSEETKKLMERINDFDIWGADEVNLRAWILQNFIPKAEIERLCEKLLNWRQCNDCFDKKHCRGKMKIPCECTCISNREEKIKSRKSDYNKALFDLLEKIKKC